MQSQSKPNKQQIRDYMAQRQQQRTPPPSIDEIRRQLGWGLLQLNNPAR